MARSSHMPSGRQGLGPVRRASSSWNVERVRFPRTPALQSERRLRARIRSQDRQPVSKTVAGPSVRRGFESLPLRTNQRGGAVCGHFPSLTAFWDQFRIIAAPWAYRPTQSPALMKRPRWSGADQHRLAGERRVPPENDCDVWGIPRPCREPDTRDCGAIGAPSPAFKARYATRDSRHVADSPGARMCCRVGGDR